MEDETIDPIAAEFASSSIGQEAAMVPPPPSPGVGQWNEFVENPWEAGAQAQGPTVDQGRVEQVAPAIGGLADALGAQSQSMAVKGNVSQGRSGWGGPKAGLRGMFDQKKAEARAGVQPALDAADAYAGAATRSIDDQIAAQNEEAGYTAQYHDQLSKLHERRMDIIDTYHSEARKIQERMATRREAYVADMTQQLSGVRALMQQSGNPLHSLSMGEQLGLGAAAFAQGFLKAGYGIDIDVSSQIDRWVQRSMQEHQQRIQNARQGMQDTMTLYDIARQGAEDDYEAQMRYKAFAIEALQAQLDSHAARFDSNIAGARAKQNRAKLDELKARTLYEAGERKASLIANAEKAALEEAYKIGQLELEKEQKQIGWYNAKTARMGEERADRAAKAKVEQGDGYVDITDIEYVKDKDGKDAVGPNGERLVQVKWRVDSKDKDAVKKARDNRNEWAQYNDRWEKVMKLREEAYAELKGMGVDPNDEGGWTTTGQILGTMGIANASIGRRASPKYQAYEAARKEFMRTQLRIESGLTVTNQEAIAKEQQYPDEMLLARGDGTDTWAEMRESARRSFDREMETYADPVPLDKPMYKVANPASPGARKVYDMGKTGGAEHVTEIQKDTATALESDGSPMDDNKATRVHDGFRRIVSQPSSPDAKISVGGLKDYMGAMDDIAKIAAEGGDDAGAAKAALANIAQTAASTPRRAYATYLMHRLVDPGRLLEDYNSGSTYENQVWSAPDRPSTELQMQTAAPRARRR